MKHNIQHYNTKHNCTQYSLLLGSVSFMLSVANKLIMLSVIMVKIAMPSVIMLSVVAPSMIIWYPWLGEGGERDKHLASHVLRKQLTPCSQILGAVFPTLPFLRNFQMGPIS